MKISTINKDNIEKKIKNNPTSFVNWYPQIKNVVKTPLSKWWDISYEDFISIIGLLDGIEIAKNSKERFDFIIKEIKSFGKEVGYPLFLKNYVFSGKHSWDRTCFIESDKNIFKHIRDIIFESEMVMCECGLGFVARQFIDTSYSPFKAFEGMPVVKERRYFIKDKKVYGRQEYWVEGAFENENLTKKQWQELRTLNLQDKKEIEYLKFETEKIIKVLDGNWSVDWLMDSKGHWWCIDLAEMHKSYISKTLIQF